MTHSFVSVLCSSISVLVAFFFPPLSSRLCVLLSYWTTHYFIRIFTTVCVASIESNYVHYIRNTHVWSLFEDVRRVVDVVAGSGGSKRSYLCSDLLRNKGGVTARNNSTVSFSPEWETTIQVNLKGNSSFFKLCYHVCVTTWFCIDPIPSKYEPPIQNKYFLTTGKLCSQSGGGVILRK